MVDCFLVSPLLAHVRQAKVAVRLDWLRALVAELAKCLAAPDHGALLLLQYMVLESARK